MHDPTTESEKPEKPKITITPTEFLRTLRKMKKTMAGRLR